MKFSQNITTYKQFFPPSLSYSVPSPQTGCHSPPRPSLTPSRRSSARKSLSGHFPKADGGNRVSLKGGKDELSAEAKITNSAPSSAPRQSPSGCSPQHNEKERKRNLSGVSVKCGYQQPTVSSRTRALSPYTHRKMCQLSEDCRQRLSHLQLGPHYFRKETESPTPFLVCSIRKKKKKKTPSVTVHLMPKIHMFSAQGL